MPGNILLQAVSGSYVVVAQTRGAGLETHFFYEAKRDGRFGIYRAGCVGSPLELSDARNLGEAEHQLHEAVDEYWRKIGFAS